MKILSWKFQLAANNIEFDSYPSKLADQHKFHCKNCDSYWWTKLSKQLNSGCPYCREIVTYLLYFPSLDLYKIGFSTNLPRRIKVFGHTAEVWLTITSDTETAGRALEQLWLSNVADYLCNTGSLSNGNTETFKI